MSVNNLILEKDKKHNLKEKKNLESDILLNYGKTPNISSYGNLSVFILLTEPPHDKTNNLHMQKQRRISASR